MTGKDMENPISGPVTDVERKELVSVLRMAIEELRFIREELKRILASMNSSQDL